MVDKPTRILLKLSGEALKGENSPFSPFSLQRICESIAAVPIQWAIVVGAGNLIRGARSPWLDRVEADTMGMLATVLNALAVQSCLVSLGPIGCRYPANKSRLSAPSTSRSCRGHDRHFRRWNGKPTRHNRHSCRHSCCIHRSGSIDQGLQCGRSL